MWILTVSVMSDTVLVRVDRLLLVRFWFPFSLSKCDSILAKTRS